MADLPFDIIEIIVDFVVADKENDTAKVAAVIPSLLLINKHWRDILQSHKFYSVAHFRFPDPRNPPRPHDYAVKKVNTIEDIRDWLSNPIRRKAKIHTLRISTFTHSQFLGLTNMLDQQFPDVSFKKIDFYVKIREKERMTVQMPKSLSTTELFIRGETNVTLDWNSFSTQLKEEVENLCLSDTRHVNIPLRATSGFTKLKNLHITTDFKFEDGKEIVNIHPHITNLRLGPISFNYDYSGNPVSIICLDSLQYLYTDNILVDFSQTQLNSLKELHMKDITSCFIPAACALGYYDDEIVNHPGLFSDLSKWRNLKYLNIHDSELPYFTELFNNGSIDDAMPNLEEIAIDGLKISKETFDGFVKRHPRIQSSHFEEYDGYDEEVENDSLEDEDDIDDHDEWDDGEEDEMYGSAGNSSESVEDSDDNDDAD